MKILDSKRLQRKSSCLFITKEGECKIIVGEKASRVELYAANELQSYLYKISGCRIPIERP